MPMWWIQNEENGKSNVGSFCQFCKKKLIIY